jgi:N-carbamoylputrescine amidase
MTAAAARGRTVVVGLVQMAMSDDLEVNTTRAVEHVRAAAGQGAEIICLPELFRSRYFCQTEDARHFDLAEPVPGATTDMLAKVATELGCVIVASLFERRAPGVYHNTAAVLDAESGYVGKYRKMHIPDDPKFYEKFYFTPGDLGFRSFQTAVASIGVLVCWDQWYPEAARLTALRGAELLLYPTAIGWHPEEKASHGQAQRDAWETVQRAHGIANGCYVAAVNRVGFEPTPGEDSGIEFWGSSFVAAPDGRVLAKAPDDAEAVVTAELDLDQIDATRTGWPFLRDRRIDAYPDITRRYIDPDDSGSTS